MNLENSRAPSGKTILAIDDEPMVRLLIKDVLEEAGYAVIDVADGSAALKIVESQSAIDLLITDVGLPGGMNGPQVVEAARNFRPGLKVLFVTGHVERGKAAAAAAAAEVIVKPFALEALETKVREMIEG